MEKTLRLPSTEEMAGAIPWVPEGRHETQAVIPNDSKLAEKLGVKQGEKILFFAGAHGDWANALSMHAQVHYTDASPEMVEHASRRFGEKIASYSARNAADLPDREYDTVMSFEPFPLSWIPAFRLLAIRSLAKAKSLKVVYNYRYNSYMSQEGDDQEEILRRAGQLYGAIFSPGEFELRRHDGEKSLIRVLHLRSNEKARKHARLDLAVLEALRDESRMHVNELAAKVRTTLPRTTRDEIDKSCDRISALLKGSRSVVVHD